MNFPAGKRLHALRTDDTFAFASVTKYIWNCGSAKGANGGGTPAISPAHTMPDAMVPWIVVRMNDFLLG